MGQALAKRGCRQLHTIVVAIVLCSGTAMYFTGDAKVALIATLLGILFGLTHSLARNLPVNPHFLLTTWPRDGRYYYFKKASSASTILVFFPKESNILLRMTKGETIFVQEDTTSLDVLSPSSTTGT